MYKLKGTITYKDGSPVKSCDIILMDEKFKEIYKTYTDKSGNYELIVETGTYKHFVAVKDYKSKNLEYWSGNIPIYEDKVIDATIDRLEIYGLHTFFVEGSKNKNLLIYCRPMTLDALYQENPKYMPNIKDISIKVNGSTVSIIDYQTILEDKELSLEGLLINVAIEEDLLDENFNLLEIQITSTEDDLGQASVFF